jgi:rRNA maturation protein Nop10
LSEVKILPYYEPVRVLTSKPKIHEEEDWDPTEPYEIQKKKKTCLRCKTIIFDEYTGDLCPGCFYPWGPIQKTSEHNLRIKTIKCCRCNNPISMVYKLDNLCPHCGGIYNEKESSGFICSECHRIQDQSSKIGDMCHCGAVWIRMRKSVFSEAKKYAKQRKQEMEIEKQDQKILWIGPSPNHSKKCTACLNFVNPNYYIYDICPHCGSTWNTSKNPLKLISGAFLVVLLMSYVVTTLIFFNIGLNETIATVVPIVIYVTIGASFFVYSMKIKQNIRDWEIARSDSQDNDLNDDEIFNNAYKTPTEIENFEEKTREETEKKESIAEIIAKLVGSGSKISEENQNKIQIIGGNLNLKGDYDLMKEVSDLATEINSNVSKVLASLWKNIGSWSDWVDMDDLEGF